MIDKSAIAGFINNADLNKKVSTLATKEELKAEQNKIIKLEALDSSWHSKLFSVSAHIQYFSRLLIKI